MDSRIPTFLSGDTVCRTQHAPATLHVNTDNGIVTRVCVTTVITNNALICPPPGVTPMSFCFRQPLRRLPAVTSPHPDDRASLPGRSPLYLLNTEGVRRLTAYSPPLRVSLPPEPS